MDTSILRSGPASVNTIGDNMDCNLSNAPAGDLPGSGIPADANTTEMTFEVNDSLYEQSLGSEVSFMCDQRRKKRRESEIRAALEDNHILSPVAQDKLLQELLGGGWGRLAHCITRHFKAPGRFGHKMVDLALITTIYDRTIACVAPVMFSAISVPDFEDETGMDEANIRKALTHLQQKGVILRIKVSPRVIFWALNPHFFKLKEKGDLPRVKSPQGNLPRGNSPRSKDGNAPCVNTGQTNPGQSTQTTGNQKEISDAKNPLQESKKESSSTSGDFPEDMLQRWAAFQKKGLEPQILREKEIFRKLFLEHKQRFFSFCGRVVEYLELRGTGKAGKGDPIRCPMSWLENHWESNLALYLNWKSEKEDLDRAYAEKLDREAKAKAKEAEEARQKSDKEKEDAKWKDEQDAAALRFLSLYSTTEEIQAFAAEAVELLGCQYTYSAWKKSGWDNPIARSCVLNHFMKVERGEIATSVQPTVREAIA